MTRRIDDIRREYLDYIKRRPTRPDEDWQWTTGELGEVLAEVDRLQKLADEAESGEALANAKYWKARAEEAERSIQRVKDMVANSQFFGDEIDAEDVVTALRDPS